MYQVKFAGINLQDYCLITNVNRSLLPPRTNFSKEVPVLNGSYYTGYKYREKVIELEVVLINYSKEDYAISVGKLAEVLNVERPSELIIGDEPWKCYYAVPDGDIKLNKVSQSGKTTLKFVCHDPIAQSLYWNAYSPNSEGIINIRSFGNIDTYPIIDVDFNNPGCFVQITSPSGETVLVGRPKDAVKPTVPFSGEIINDNCQDASTFSTLAPSLLDKNLGADGAHGIGFNGDGMVCTNYGTAVEEKWTGTAFKRALDRNVRDFEVTIDVAFSSKGKNYEPPKPQPPVTPPKPPTPPSKPNNNSGNPPSSSLGTYKVVNCGGLWINREPNTRHPLHAMSPGELIYPTEIKGKWYKHTKSYKFGTYTGWSYGRYLKKVSNNGRARTRAHNEEIVTNFGATVAPKVDDSFAESQLGIIQIYGYDQNGAKLFKFEVSDTSEYYEYVNPKLIIGSKTVLEDGKTVSAPRKIKVKDENGKEAEELAASGVYGDFNDFIGQLVVKREQNSSGQQLWSGSIKKIVDGKVISAIEIPNSLSGSDYPKGDLNYLGFYIGRFGQFKEMDIAAITNIKVKQLNIKTDQVVDSNLQIFNPGDHLQLNFETGEVTLNDENLLPQVDIGSEFFTIPPNNSQILVRSDSQNTAVVCGFKDRFI